MEKHEHVITLPTSTKDRVDQLIRCYKASVAKDILQKLLEVGSIDTVVYGCELRSLYSSLGFRRIE